MATKNWAIAVIIGATLLTTSAQIFLKRGADHVAISPLQAITSLDLYAGIVIYGLAAILMVIAFHHGDISVLYPLFSTSYVWVTLAAFYLLGESITLTKWAGVFTIIFGLILIAKTETD